MGSKWGSISAQIVAAEAEVAHRHAPSISAVRPSLHSTVAGMIVAGTPTPH